MGFTLIYIFLNKTIFSLVKLSKLNKLIIGLKMSASEQFTQEEIRLKQDRERQAYWRRWGCYLSDRSWGTVREDYSKDGSAWEYFDFE